jgi:adenosine deaminase
MNREDIIKLPKLDLHCHLDGSLSKVFLENTLGRNFTMEELSISMDCNSLVEYLEKFDVPLEAMNSRDNIKAATIDVMKSAADEGVRYIEIRFAPLLSVSGNVNTRDVIESVIEGLKLGSQTFNIHGNAICCAMTHHDIKDSMSMFKIAREYYGSGVAGLDLAGDEANHPIGEFKELFGFAKELGMNFTIHAGEAGPKSNIEGAIEYGAKRIGHGIAMRNDERLLKLAKDKSIGIEMCPISNYQTKAVGREDIYPYSDYIKKGILATINTDNRLVSNTSITKEILFLQDKSMINDEEIVKGIKNAIEVSFASDEIKEMLWKEC